MPRKPTTARGAAIGALSRREHSRRELARKLHGKGFAEDEIAETLDDLQQARLLSDERFVEMLIHSRRERGCGPLRIRHELQEHGITADLLSLHLDDKNPEWLVLAREVKRKRFGEAAPPDRKEWARQAQFLTYRGFTREQIREVLREQGYND
jgi:regulatory protein